MKHYDQHYSDGQWRTSTGDDTLSVINPYTEERMATLQSCSAADVAQAVQSAQQAFPLWSRSSVETRAALLRRVADILKERQQELAQTISRELGMPIKLAQRIQVGSPIMTFELTASALERFVWEEKIGNSVVVREAAGVVAAITPWNYPLHQIAAKVAPALASGCTVVLKPSEITPLNALILAEAFALAGAPAGVFNMVLGRGPSTGEALVTHPDVDLVSFTGSTSAGSRIMGLAAQSIKRVRLELGGKGGAIILPGADLQKAVKATVNSCLLNSGQTCSALTRLIVSEADYAVAAELAATHASSFSLGDPFADGTRLGPLVSHAQRERVRRFIGQGLEEGATLLAGGTATPEGLAQGFFVAPTVLGNVESSHTVAQQEIFGPVLSILRYRDTDHAIDIANSTAYGLAASVWGAETSLALAVANQVRAGQVDINGAPFNMEAPFGGFGQSGFGRELGKFGLDEFLELKSYQMPVH